jgi:hypothetical protein
MSDSIKPAGRKPDSVAFFDWRARRNWVVLIGSALTTGVVAAVLAYVFSVVVLDLPSAPLSLSDVVKVWLVGGLLFLLVVILMGSMATRGRETQKQETRPRVGPMARRAAQRLDLKLHALWCVVFGLPPLAMRFMFFSLRDTPGAVEVTVVMIMVGIVAGPVFLPGLLQRWGRRKAARHA